MKPTRSGTKWVHVSCALWIPEVGTLLGGSAPEPVLLILTGSRSLISRPHRSG